VSNETKLRAVDEYDSLLLISSPSEARIGFNLVFPMIAYASMLCWRRNVVRLRADVSDARYRKLTVSSLAVAVRKEAWFPEAETLVIVKFKEERENGMKVSTLWFSKTMKDCLAVLFPDKSADDFVAGDGWRSGFFARHGLSMRVATNVMPLSVHERVPACLKFYKTIQQVCAKNGGMNFDWGAYRPSHRYNADEVGIEFGCILRRTAELRGAKRVWVAQPKHRIEARECTFLPLFCAGLAVLQCSIFLRAAPKKLGGGRVDPTTAAWGPTRVLIQKLRQKYPNIDIYCQPKGYMDDITFLTWFENTFLPTAGNHPQLLVLDNLGHHCTAEIREFAALHDVLLLFSPPYCTDLIQVTDLGLGFAIKRTMKEKFVDHYHDNHVAWEKGEVPPEMRKTLHVKWLSESIQEFYDSDGQKMVEKVFARCGLLTSLREERPQRRHITGYNEDIVVKWQE